MIVTKTQREALAWLQENGGDGLVTRAKLPHSHNLRPAVLARGKVSHCHPQTWQRLEAAGLVYRYTPPGAKWSRVKVTAAGLRFLEENT